MKLTIATRIAAERVRSLVWEGETLVDWVSGGRRYQLDGSTLPRPVYYAYRFDAACSSPSGTYTVIYELLGTKGLVLKQGRILREIDRSFYHATAYEYPVCIAQRESGQEVLIHCPEHYNQLEIDDLETGQRLTPCENREPADLFHSRLQADPKGVHFLSAGWFWHPHDELAVYRLQEAIRDPRSLDKRGIFAPQPTEISSAALLDDRYVVISTSDETFADDEELGDDGVIRPNSIALWDLAEAKLITQSPLAGPAGTLMAIDSQFAVGFYEHPKVIDIRTGEVVFRLDDVDSGKQTSSIIHHVERPAPLAVDPQRRRFAVATSTEILVVQAERAD